MRYSKADVQYQVDDLNRRLGYTPEMPDCLMVEWAYGHPRVFSHDGAVEVSPRLATRDMMTWLRGARAAVVLKRRP